MADAWIACVDQSEGRITSVRFLKRGGSWQTVTRAAVLKHMSEVGGVYTCYKDATGKLVAGAQVHPQKVNGVVYLQTEPNSIARDNLGQLPSLQACPV